jgi:hypothetical protein
MRTTLDIDDDVLQAAKEIAQRQGSTAGRVLSALARKGLVAAPVKKASLRGGLPVLPSRGEFVTPENVQQLMDKEGV